MKEHPAVFTRKQELRSEFRKANEIIDRIRSDELFMKFMSGEKQRIMTFDLFGVPWKMKMDSYLPNPITDLKSKAKIRHFHFGGMTCRGLFIRQEFLLRRKRAAVLSCCSNKGADH